MTSKRIFDEEGHAHFVTYSCYRRRRLLDHDRSKKVVLGVLRSQLSKQSGRCVGFVIMLDHVHAIVWFPEANQLSHFMKQWKQRSSFQIKRLAQDVLLEYYSHVDLAESFWQAGYYGFNLFAEEKTEEN